MPLSFLSAAGATGTPQALQLLAKSTAQYPGMLCYVHMRADGSFYLPFASAGIAKVFKLRPEDVAEDAAPLFARVHPDDLARVMVVTFRSAERLSTWRDEYRVLDADGQVRWVGGSAEPERLSDGSTLWRGYMEDITERKAAEHALRRASELPQLLSETAAGFINLPLTDVEAAIQASLGRIAAFLDVDRAYIFAYDFERRITINTFEWCGPGIQPCIDDLQATPLEMTPEWVEHHSQGRPMYLPDIPGLPPGTMKDLLVPQGIKSLIAVPMMKGEACVGFVGFDSVKHHRVYSEEEQHLLDLFARMLVNVQLRRADQAALQRSERRFSDVIEAADEFVWEVDREWRVSYLSSRAEELLGRKVEKMLGESLASLIGDGEADGGTRALLAEASARGRPIYRLETRHLRSDRLLRHYLSNSRPVFAEDGRLTGHIGMSMDVTQEKEISRELHQAREQAEIFFEASHDLLAILTPEGRFVRCSRSWERLLGCSLRQLEGRRYMDYVHPDDAAGTEEIFGDLLKGKVVAGYINRYHCGQGRYVHLEWWAQHIDDRVYASARDVTRTKEAEHALERALEQERAAVEIKGRLISMASHEFRTPLTVIRMRAEMLGLTLPNLDTAAIRERLGSIVEACSHLTEIVTDVLDYSSLGRAESVEQPADIEFGSLLSDLVTGLERGEAEDRRINLCMPQHPMYLKSYASLLRRAVGNVLENALKYSPSPLPVRVTCSAKNHGVLLEVADKGIGIPPGEVSDLFNPFYRASNVGRVRGTGLGLAICKEAMDRLGGTISHRPNPDGGSIFTLLFPPHPPTCNNPRPAKGTAVPFATVTCMHNE